MRILLVEDDVEVARFVKKGLQEAGHTVEHATNGRDGLFLACLLYTSPSPRDGLLSRMPSSA